MKIRNMTLAAAAAGLFLAPTLATPSAQANVLKKHPLMASAAAGIAAHHYAKKGAAGRAAAGQRPNFAERHPMMSGAAAAIGAHHFLKHKAN
jgi:hypothetical protein